MSPSLFELSIITLMFLLAGVFLLWKRDYVPGAIMLFVSCTSLLTMTKVVPVFASNIGLGAMGAFLAGFYAERDLKTRRFISMGFMFTLMVVIVALTVITIVRGPHA